MSDKWSLSLSERPENLKNKIEINMNSRTVIIFCILCVISSVGTFAQTGLYTYDGGYFVRNGNNWTEYRPKYKEGVWATYTQYNEEEHFFNITNDLCDVSVPKSSVNKFYYSDKKEGDWKPIYDTRQVYDYMPSSGCGIYCYKGGYFVRDGLKWREYRPADKHGVWAEFDQQSYDEYFFYIINDNDRVAVPVAESGGDIQLFKESEWKPIYSLTGIYDFAAGYEYSLSFSWYRKYDSGTEEYGDSLAVPCRVSFDSYGNGEVRYSQTSKSFDFKSFGLYDNQSSAAGGFLLLLFLGIDGFSADEGFAFYSEGDGESPVMTYVSSSDDATCSIEAVSGLPKLLFGGCNSKDVGDKVRSLIADKSFSL